MSNTHTYTHMSHLFDFVWRWWYYWFVKSDGKQYIEQHVVKPTHKQSLIQCYILESNVDSNNNNKPVQMIYGYVVFSSMHSLPQKYSFISIHSYIVFDSLAETTFLRVRAVSQYSLENCQFYMRGSFIPLPLVSALERETISFSVIHDPNTCENRQGDYHEYPLNNVPSLAYFKDPKNGYMYSHASEEEETYNVQLSVKIEIVACENCSIDYSLLPPGYDDTCTLNKKRKK